MAMKVCIDCGTVFPAENFGAKRCCLCAAKYKTKTAAPKVYPKPPVDALTRDVREADAAGISYGKLQVKRMLAKQKAREELEAKRARNAQKKKEGKNK